MYMCKLHCTVLNDVSPQIIQVTAIRDDIPELDETYTVYLLDPDTLGDLSDINHSANVTILANQHPHGLLQIFPTDRYCMNKAQQYMTLSSIVHARSDVSELAMEESTRYVELEIRRSFGTFGEVSVTMESVEGEALATSGNLT